MIGKNNNFKSEMYVENIDNITSIIQEMRYNVEYTFMQLIELLSYFL